MKARKLSVLQLMILLTLVLLTGIAMGRDRKSIV